VFEHVAEGWASAQPTPFELCLGRHRSLDSHLNACSLAFAGPTEDRHDHGVGLVTRIDRSADLGHPQRHTEVVKQRESVVELSVIEDTLRLTDHHRIEPAVWALQCLQKASSIRATARRYRPGLVNVEELGDDPSVPANQSLSTAPLPSTRGLGVLEIVRGHTCPQGESELVSFL